jgi:small subunit ribosomal protein S18
MVKKAKKNRRRFKRADVGDCPFCESKIDPDYKDYNKLEKYLTDRGRIIGGIRSGVCSKHQRRLTLAIKRARHLGLLPYTPSL